MGLKDGGSYERLYIIGKLANMGEKARPLLPEVLIASRDESPTIRSQACDVIGRMKASGDAVMQELADSAIPR